MAKTKIALDAEAYEALRMARRPGESFSGVVKRLFRARRHLAEFAGGWSHLSPREPKEVRDSLVATRAAARSKIRRRYPAPE